MGMGVGNNLALHPTAGITIFDVLILKFQNEYGTIREFHLSDRKVD
jgi:hypothetical protein